MALEQALRARRIAEIVASLAMLEVPAETLAPILKEEPRVKALIERLNLKTKRMLKPTKEDTPR